MIPPPPAYSVEIVAIFPFGALARKAFAILRRCSRPKHLGQAAQVHQVDVTQARKDRRALGHSRRSHMEVHGYARWK
jgi:hypothetical protein